MSSETSNRINIMYLTWGENITGGIFRNQVEEQIKSIVSLPEHDISIKIVSGITFVRKSLLNPDGKKNHFWKTNHVSRRVRLNQIEHHIRWIPVPSKWFQSKYYQHRFFSFGHLRFIGRFVEKHEIQIVHCRGYHAARVALLAKKILKLNIKVIFDTRGMFPEEGVVLGVYESDSMSFDKWKRIENWSLDHADAIVNVSNTFTKHVKTITTQKNIHTIYTSTNIDIFQSSDDDRCRSREGLDIGRAEKTLVYLGSISDRGWHSITNLLSVYKTFSLLYEKAKLLIITRSSKEYIESKYLDFGLTHEQLLIVSASSSHETAKYLSSADYAILPYRPVCTEIERLIGYTMIASKTGEYLATGLPLIVNSSVGAASDLVEKYNIGCIYQSGNEQTLVSALKQIDAQYTDVSNRCRQVAEKYFSTTVNAEKYANLYASLLAS